MTPSDVGKRKAFDKGVRQLAEEGAIQILYSEDRFSDPIYGAVGQLQFEVMQYRLQDEYQVKTTLTLLPYQASAWIIGDIQTYEKPFGSILVKDRMDKVMGLFGSPWEKQFAAKKNPNHQLLDIKYE